MSYELILLVAAMTYASRMAALAILPTMPPRIATVLERMPAPLFAGLAATSVVAADGGSAGSTVLVATATTVLAAPFRSLAACLVAGLAGYAAAAILGL